MPSFAVRIRPYVDREIESSHLAESQGELRKAFRHLERAHVMGQSSTAQHVRVHCHMLRWGWRRRDIREVLGQLLRIAGAATKTVFGLVPVGNTGGANISPFRRLPVDPDLSVIIDRAQSRSRPG